MQADDRGQLHMESFDNFMRQLYQINPNISIVIRDLACINQTSPTGYHQSPSRHVVLSATAMAFFKITLLRSGIGLPYKRRGVLAALGLRKRMTTVYHPVCQDVAGMIMQVKELLLVEEVKERKTKEQMKTERRPDPGFYVERKAGGSELD